MKKNTARMLIVAAIAFVIYNVIVFMVPIFDTYSEVFWPSYIFTVIAFVVVGASVYLGVVARPDAKSKFYSFPIAKIGLIYFVIQLIAGLVIMLLGDIIPSWLALLLFLVGLGAALIGLIGVDAVVDNIQQMDRKQQADTSRMRALQSRVSQMAAQCAGNDAAAEVRNLAEEFRFSDPVSSESLFAVENDLFANVNMLQQAVVDGDAAQIRQLCAKTAAVLGERNRLCKLNKQ